ncbi:hypothetical protein [Edaphocola aurantiacus]|uniref:hypothetical protein n=1 Tax=Edaphocola aurantiacus TaxID=2601682 RepID=UPI001C93FBAF|nr:hypothetical protein [Edaphocola aurantiacus]
MNKKIKTAMLLAITVLAGCRQDVFPAKENPEESNPLPSAIVKEQDYLAFASMQTFNRAMEQMQGDKESPELFEKRYPGYRSMRLLQDSIQGLEDQSGSIWSQANIPDPYFRTVLSAEGRIRIADTLYQFEPGKEQGIAYAVPMASAKELLSGKTPPQKIKGVAIYQTTMNMLPFPKWADDPIKIDDPSTWELCRFPDSFMIPWWGQKGGAVYHDDSGAELPRDNGRRIRIDYHRWRVGYVFYSSIGIRVKIWKDTRFGGWMSNIRMDKVFMEACTEGRIITPGIFPVPFHENAILSADNTNVLEKTLKWSAAPMHTEVMPEHFNFHFKALFRGRPVERYINE